MKMLLVFDEAFDLCKYGTITVAGAVLGLVVAVICVW